MIEYALEMCFAFNCLVEDFNGELIYIGDDRDALLNIDKELDKDEQNVFTVK